MQVKFKTTLKFWESSMLPEAKRDNSGKIMKDPQTGKFLNTGNHVEYTTYTFRDFTGETFKIMSAKNDFRSLENEDVEVTLDITRKEFQGKSDTRVSLVNVMAI